MSDVSLQREFKLLNETLNSLTVSQTYLLLFVLICIIYNAGAWYWGIQMIDAKDVNSILKAGHKALYAATLSFALYPLFYWIQHSETKRLTFERISIMPHVFFPVVIILLLIVLANSEFAMKGKAISEFWPVIFGKYTLIPCIYFGVASLRQSVLASSIFGAESNWGTQIIVIIIFLLLYMAITFDISIMHNKGH